jgi:hypothetical protein
MDGGGQGRVSSYIFCGTDGSSSPVKVYRRCICDSWWAWACVCRRTGIAPWYMVSIQKQGDITNNIAY